MTPQHSPRRSRPADDDGINLTMLAAGVAVGLLLLLAAGGAWWRLRGATPVAVAPDEAQTIADAFLKQIASKQVDLAWQSTTAEFKSNLGRDSFRQYVARQPELRGPLEFADCRPVEANGLARYECDFAAKPAGAAPAAQVQVLLAEEAGAWKVERVGVKKP